MTILALHLVHVILRMCLMAQYCKKKVVRIQDWKCFIIGGNWTTFVQLVLEYSSKVADFLRQMYFMKSFFPHHSLMLCFPVNRKGLETLIYIVHEVCFHHKIMIKRQQSILQNQMSSCHNVVTTSKQAKNGVFHLSKYSCTFKLEPLRNL